MCSYSQKKRKPEKYKKCMEELAARYVFYLSFENSRCKEYITEKFWRPLNKGNIPVVLGGLSKAEYEELAPPNSFIHVDDFRSPAHLGAYMKYLQSNLTALAEYHAWRADYDIIFERRYTHWCHLCDLTALHSAEVTPAKRSVRDWFLKKTCQ